MITIKWYDGKTYSGHTAREVVEKMATSNPLGYEGNLLKYTVGVFFRCARLGVFVRPYPYDLFIQDLKDNDVIKELRKCAS